MNHSTTEIVAAISSVNACGRASCESLNLIFNSPILGGIRPYSSPAVINAQWTREVPGKPGVDFTQRREGTRKGAKSIFFVPLRLALRLCAKPSLNLSHNLQICPRF